MTRYTYKQDYLREKLIDLENGAEQLRESCTGWQVEPSSPALCDMVNQATRIKEKAGLVLATLRNLKENA